jgi:hypothetical protein
MADQNNDDSKTPFARRGARPFGGPATSPAPSRPFIRPVTAQRPTAAPFVSPVVPGKLVLRNAAPAPAVEPPAPVAPSAIPLPEADAAPLSAGPVPSEMAALDAIDAFDEVWGVAEPPGAPSESAAVASPLDELSLGSGTEGQHQWAEDITADDIPAGKPETVAAPVAFEPTDSSAPSTTPAWLEDDVALPPVPSESPVVSMSSPAVTDVPSAPSVVSPVADVEGLYSLGEWTDSHTIPASDEIMGVLPEPMLAPIVEALGDAAPASPDRVADDAQRTPEPHPRFELVEASPEKPQPEVPRDELPVASVTPAPAAFAFAPHEARIAATFDRLADRVRSGEIDVSSIAPDATDAAVVASVLVALLGGSRSR